MFATASVATASAATASVATASAATVTAATVATASATTTDVATASAATANVATASAATEAMEVEEATEEYTIKCIHEEKGKGKGLKYLVEWEGYAGEKEKKNIRPNPCLPSDTMLGRRRGSRQHTSRTLLH